MKQIILNAVLDLVSSFLYYDRKEDEDLPCGEIEKAIKNQEISITEIEEYFSKKLREGLKNEN